MRKFFLALSVSALLVGGALASSLEDSEVSNSVGMENSAIVQHGYNNAVNAGTEISHSRVVNSEVSNEVYMKNSSIRQRGAKNYVNTGTKVEE
ncbi:MAG: hypothetical protein DSY59_01590 [Persephonella sp.]|nr:MAG: hypothetical protein DSY60_05415 [Persephonella sp.]RUM61454.1 MAG: hypothetical protein DSY59_01590 [Persephonella sp.]